ncbi:MAG: hypothetical protein JW874_12175, partial [Spirochaetales bacterium]|nr:hypothetical protein [Spirochaetales bacterium]
QRCMKRIGEILVENNLITRLQLDDALAEQQKEEGRGKRIGEILIEKKYISYDTFIEYLGIQKARYS